MGAGFSAVVVPLQVVKPILVGPVIRHVVIHRGDDSVARLAEDGRLVALRIRLASFVCLIRCHAFTSVCSVNGSSPVERLALTLRWQCVRVCLACLAAVRPLLRLSPLVVSEWEPDPLSCVEAVCRGTSF